MTTNNKSKTMEDYSEVRNNLLALLAELEQRFGKITDNITHANEPLSHDFAEQVTELENSEVVDFLGNFTRAEITQVKQAIKRIDEGEYGVCVDCGEIVQPERLKILPFTPTCIRCAEKAEH
jgi:RNA polymerase-binding transcription factor DksA